MSTPTATTNGTTRGRPMASTEVATTTAGRVAVNVGVPLKGLDEAYRLSQALAMAGLMPSHLRGKPSDVLAILLYGQEVGLAPMQAVQGIYVVNGRPTLAAQTWLALLRRAGHRAFVPCKRCGGSPEEHVPGRARADHAYESSHDERSCKVTIVRGDNGAMHTESFSLDDAKTAGLAAKDVWKSHPKRMTLARCVSNAARFLCPEVAMGFYAEGEEFDETGDEVFVHTVEQAATAAAEQAPVEDAHVVEESAAQVAQIAEQFNFGGDAARESNQCTVCGKTGHYDDEHDPAYGDEQPQLPLDGAQ